MENEALLETVTHIIPVGGAIAAIVSSLWLAVNWVARNVCDTATAPIKRELAVQGLKVDTMWSASMRRAEAGAVIRGMGTMNSPVVFNAETLSWADGMKDDLQAAYRADWRHLGLSNDDLCLAIERRFGQRIVREICIPHGIADGTCLLLAAAVAKGDGD